MIGGEFCGDSDGDGDEYSAILIGFFETLAWRIGVGTK